MAQTEDVRFSCSALHYLTPTGVWRGSPLVIFLQKNKANFGCAQFFNEDSPITEIKKTADFSTVTLHQKESFSLAARSRLYEHFSPIVSHNDQYLEGLDRSPNNFCHAIGADLILESANFVLDVSG
jgi:hypothetical protein